MMTDIPGRSHLRGEVSRAELLARTIGFEASRHLFSDSMSDWAYDVRLVEGDLVVDGSLAMFERRFSALVVTGDLVVHGSYSDGDDPESGVFVLGDMRAENVFTAGWLNLAGDLIVHNGLIGDYNDCSAFIGGKTTARFLYTEEHWFTFRGAVHVETVLGEPRGNWPRSTRLKPLPPARYPNVLVPEVFYLDGARGHPFDPSSLSDEELEDLDDLLYVDDRVLRRRADQGQPIFR
jgi:hypothetical protein